MSQGQKAFPVSWDQFHRDARALAWRLAESGPFGAIICITRGGLVPAAIVSRELGVRVIETVCIASYHDYANQGELQVLKHIADAVMQKGETGGKGILVIDDLVDTGKTARIVRDMLPDAHFATVYAKPLEGLWSIHSSRKCRRTRGSIFRGIWGWLIRHRLPRGIRGEGIELLLSVPHPSFKTLDSLADRFTQAMDDVSVALWLCRVVDVVP